MLGICLIVYVNVIVVIYCVLFGVCLFALDLNY